MDALAHTAVLALGSNLGESETILEQAAADLVHLSGGAVRLVGASGLYVTEPVGGPADQPDYINAVLEMRTSLDPYALLVLCQQVEAHHHRVRLVRWGPRTLDIDVITYDDLVSDDPVLPRPIQSSVKAEQRISGTSLSRDRSIEFSTMTLMRVK